MQKMQSSAKIVSFFRITNGQKNKKSILTKKEMNKSSLFVGILLPNAKIHFLKGNKEAQSPSTFPRSIIVISLFNL